MEIIFYSLFAVGNHIIHFINRIVEATAEIAEENCIITILKSHSVAAVGSQAPRLF